MDAAQIKKFAQDLQKQTDTVIFCIEHNHHNYSNQSFSGRRHPRRPGSLSPSFLSAQSSRTS